MRPEVKDKLDRLPHEPGVYLMKDAQGEVFYVGKAKSLRDRVRQYFSGTDTRAFVALLDELLADLEVVITHSDKEAMLVEDELVKRYQPRFNVKLTDDKRFLCLRLDVRQPYPRLEVVRRFGKDGARYFGPYTSAASAREALRLINRHFQLRTCSDQVLANRTRPCLQFQIKRCPAPCVFDVKSTYAENVDDVVKFLSGKESELVGNLTGRMKQHAEAMNYEAAAQVRDQVRAVSRSLERQRIVSSDFVSRDVVGLYRQGPTVEIHVMRTREGRLIDAQRFSFDELELPSTEILSDFATRYYTAAADVPDEILFSEDMEWGRALEEVLLERKQRKIEVLIPRRGDKRRLVELAQRNAEQAFVDKQRERGAHKSAAERLQRALHLSRPPQSLECFDISHLQGAQVVASVVRFENGMAQKERYRHYAIKSFTGQDDFQAMYEVMSRRARRGLEEADLPDLFVIDGGKGQLNAARAALDDHGIDTVDLVSLAKERRYGPLPGEVPAAVAEPGGAESDDDVDLTEAEVAVLELSESTPDSGSSRAGVPERVFVLGNKNPIVLKPNSAELFVLTRARDEAHRFAITFHRKKRRKAATRSLLDGIPGIGPKRKRELLRAFGSVARLKNASVADIARVVGDKAAAAVASHIQRS